MTEHAALESALDGSESDGATAPYLILDEEVGIRIREATEEDAPYLAAIGTRAFQYAHFGILDLSSLAGVSRRFDVAAMEREIREAGSRYLIGIWDGNPVGLAHLRSAATPSTLGGGLALELHGLYVAPDWARHGVGSALVRGAVALAEASGSENLWCAVMESNRGAVLFFRSQGFHCSRRERMVIGKRRRVVLVLGRRVGSR